MQYLVLVAVILLILFSFVLLFGAPYLPTLKKQVDEALDLLDLQKGQTLLELGCGDGRVLRAAAKRGLHGVGYELNPLLVIIARIYTWRYRKQIKIIWGDYWLAEWPKAEGIFVFLLQKYMHKLDKKIIHWHKDSVKLVSFAFTISNKKPAAAKNGLYLYKYR